MFKLYLDTWVKCLHRLYLLRILFFFFTLMGLKM